MYDDSCGSEAVEFLIVGDSSSLSNHQNTIMRIEPGIGRDPFVFECDGECQRFHDRTDFIGILGKLRIECRDILLRDMGGVVAFRTGHRDHFARIALHHGGDNLLCIGMGFHLVEDLLDTSLKTQGDIEMKIETVYAGDFGAASISDDGTDYITLAFEEAVFSRNQMFLCVALKSLHSFGPCIAVVILFSDIADDGRQAVIEREASRFTTLDNIEAVKHIDSLSDFDRAKDFKFSQFEGE